MVTYGPFCYSIRPLSGHEDQGLLDQPARPVAQPLGDFLSGVTSVCPSSLLLSPPPAATAHLRLPPSLGRLDVTPHPTSRWTAVSSARLVTMGVLEPSCPLLLLPVLLTVGGESGASAAVTCIFSSGWGQGWAESREGTGQDNRRGGLGREGSSRACGPLPELEASKIWNLVGPGGGDA